MKISITLEVPEGTKEVTPKVEVKTVAPKDDYYPKPPFTGTMIVKARRVQDKNKENARVYKFKYRPDEYPEVNGLSKGVPLTVGVTCSVRVNPNQFHPTSKGLLSFRITEHDNYGGPDSNYYPVLFDVFDFEWEEDNQ